MTRTEDSRPKPEDRSVHRPPSTVYYAGVIAVAGVIAYANSFGAPFQLDDFGSILENPTILHLSNLGDVLSPPRESGITVNGRPLLNLTFAINHAISGFNVWSYHLVNLAIHLAAALTLFGIVRRTVAQVVGRPLADRRHGASAGPTDQATAVALGASLLWMLHPLQTEAVTYVVQRAESLVSLFYLLTIYCFVRATEMPSAVRRKSSGCWLLSSVLCCLAGMATKEVMVSAPLIALLFDRTFVAGSFGQALRLRWRYYLGLCASWILLGWLVLHASGRGGTAGATEHVVWWQYLFTQCRAIVLYLRLVIWPSPLVFDYGMGVEQSLGPIAVQAIFLTALFVGMLIALVRRPILGFFAALFFALLAPSSSVVPVVTQTMAEHRVYLALAAIAVPSAVLLHRWLGSRSLWIMAGLALLLGVLTSSRNRDYRSGLILWGDTVAKYPSSARAQNNFGASLVQLDRVDEAIPHFREAIRIRPEYLRARSNLAQALQRTGDGAGAIEQFTEMLRIHPEAEGHVLTAHLLEQAGRRAEAISHLREAIRLKPDSGEAHNNLGNALMRDDRPAEAIVEYRAAIAANPKDAAAYSNLGSALASTGKLDEGAAAQETALQLNPSAANPRVGLALIRIRQNRIPEAIELLNRVLADNPDHAVARSTLASIRAGKQ